jgi:hypothetical protein
VSAETRARDTDAEASPAPSGTRVATLWGFYAITALLSVALAFALVATLQRVLVDDETVEAVDSWVVESIPPDVELSAPSTAVPPPPPPDENAGGAEATVVNWREEAKLRRAAGVLLLANDYEGAMELLLQISAEDSRAFALDRAAHRRILDTLRTALLDERRVLALYESGTRGREKEGTDRQARARVLRFVSMPAGRVHLPEVAARLPDKVALIYIRNVHLRLARLTKASDTLLALVLGLGFRQGSDAARVYWEEFPSAYGDYDEVL